jgi:hypothetical protein
MTSCSPEPRPVLQCLRQLTLPRVQKKLGLWFGHGLAMRDYDLCTIIRKFPNDNVHIFVTDCSERALVSFNKFNSATSRQVLPTMFHLRILTAIKPSLVSVRSLDAFAENVRSDSGQTLYRPQ